MHIRVPDRGRAAAWYADNLGFEPVDEYEFWANGVDGGPLQISADGGVTSLALFKASDSEPIVPQRVAFARSLPGEICGPDGEALRPEDVRDFDLCWAFDLADPWGHHYELNCYEHQAVERELIEVDGIVPVRYWPADLHRERLGRG